MSEEHYMVRTPLLDLKQQVKGYKLAWQKNDSSPEAASDADLYRLLALAGKRAGGASLGLLFLNAGSAALSDETLQGLAPENTVLMLNRSALQDESQLAIAHALREQGFGLALRDADLAFLKSNEQVLALLSYLEVGLDHPDIAAMTQLVRHAQPQLSVLAERLPDGRTLDDCAGLAVDGFFTDICSAPVKSSAPGELGPQTVLILQLMQMVQENADVRELEKLLKRDAVLSYKLLRYINSPFFGIDVEIQSLRHAVTMLGYSPLFRWLSLFLAMTHTADYSPGLLQAAIVRGRFAELLGQGLLSKSEAENLFIVGMFSLLDRLLGIPVQEVLKQITLPEAIAQALLSRDGEYGPFVALVEACEREQGGASELADALFMTARQVNQAHLSALAWAQTLKL